MLALASQVLTKSKNMPMINTKDICFIASMLDKANIITKVINAVRLIVNWVLAEAPSLSFNFPSFFLKMLLANNKSESEEYPIIINNAPIVTEPIFIPSKLKTASIPIMSDKVLILVNAGMNSLKK